MRATEIRKWLSDQRGGKRQSTHLTGYRPDPALADLMGALRLSVRVADVPASMESLAIHVASLDERLAALEQASERRTARNPK